MTTIKFYITIFLSVIFFYSCTGRKKTIEGEKLKNHSPKYLIDTLQKTNLNFDWLRIKGNAQLTFQGGKYNIKSNFRIRKDSAIWVNLSKSAIPLFTTILSEDSVKFLLKLSKEKYLGGYQEINELLNLDVNYYLLQDFIVGQPIMFDSESKYKSRIDNGLYLLSSDKSKKIDKLIKKGKGNKKHNLLYRCWLNPSNFRCEKVEINFLSDSTNVKVNYSNWIDLNGQLFPEKSSIYVTTSYDTLSLEMEYSNKIKINEPQKMNFKVSDKYKPFQFNDEK